MNVWNSDVAWTNDEATDFKCSAISAGYWHDSYLMEFQRILLRSSEVSARIVHVGSKVVTLPQRERRLPPRSPEINRGQFVRVKGVEHLVRESAATFNTTIPRGHHIQIINLGCGFDSLYWRLCDSLDVPFVVFDVDMPNVIKKKSKAIESSELLLGHPNSHGNSNHVYCPVGVDISDFRAFQHALTTTNPPLSFDRPTIIVAECVLVYLSRSGCSELLSWISKSFSSQVVFINYEQVNMDDEFGRIMVANVAERGAQLPGIVDCQSCQSQVDRFLRAGFEGSIQFLTMNDIYDRALVVGGRAEMERVRSLEWLDEPAIMKQLFHHYTLGYAFNLADLHADLFVESL